MKPKVFVVLFLCALSILSVRADSSNQSEVLDSLALRMAELEQAWTESKSIDNRQNDSLYLELAHCQRTYAYTAGKVGKMQEAQEYAQRAYEAFMFKGEWGSASLCLYERFVAYNNIGDTTHMAELTEALRVLAEKDTSALTQFNYYSIMLANYAALGLGEEAIAAGRKSINYLEQIKDYRRWNILPVWNYYNQALMYDFFREPPQTDSIAYWLDRAEMSIAGPIHPLDRQEAMISIGDLRAWLYYYQKDYVRAERKMLEVLSLIDSVGANSPASIVTERGEAYAFFVELYETLGRHAQALEFQKLLTENNKERYDIERQRVLDDVQTRYEVKLQKATIARQKSVLRLVSVISVLVVLAIVFALLAVLYRKRQIEETLYAKALEADNMYTALQQVRERTNTEPLEIMRGQLLSQIRSLSDRTKYKQEAISRVEQLNLQTFKQNILEAESLSVMDKRYLMCFAAGLSAEQVADVFNVEPASVYTVRYRIRKKFPKEKSFI